PAPPARGRVAPNGSSPWPARRQAPAPGGGPISRELSVCCAPPTRPALRVDLPLAGGSKNSPAFQGRSRRDELAHVGHEGIRRLARNVVLGIHGPLRNVRGFLGEA